MSVTHYTGMDIRVYIDLDFNETEEWDLVGCSRSDSFTINNEAIDATAKCSMPWKTLMNGGVRNVSISCSGVYGEGNGIKTREDLVNAIINTPIAPIKIELEGCRVLRGNFAITTEEWSGEHADAEQWSVNLESTGQVNLWSCATRRPWFVSGGRFVDGDNSSGITFRRGSSALELSTTNGTTVPKDGDYLIRTVDDGSAGKDANSFYKEIRIPYHIRHEAKFGFGVMSILSADATWNGDSGPLDGPRFTSSARFLDIAGAQIGSEITQSYHFNPVHDTNPAIPDEWQGDSLHTGLLPAEAAGIDFSVHLWHEDNPVGWNTQISLDDFHAGFANYWENYINPRPAHHQYTFWDAYFGGAAIKGAADKWSECTLTDSGVEVGFTTSPGGLSYDLQPSTSDYFTGLDSGTAPIWNVDQVTGLCSIRFQGLMDDEGLRMVCGTNMQASNDGIIMMAFKLYDSSGGAQLRKKIIGYESFYGKWTLTAGDEGLRFSINDGIINHEFIFPNTAGGHAGDYVVTIRFNLDGDGSIIVNVNNYYKQFSIGAITPQSLLDAVYFGHDEFLAAKFDWYGAMFIYADREVWEDHIQFSDREEDEYFAWMPPANNMTLKDIS